MDVKKLCLIFIIPFVLSAQVFANYAQVGIIEQNIEKIDSLFLLESESLPNADVIKLSQNIIQNRSFYNNNTLGKVFSLLADTAINKGDLALAMQFSLDGESLDNIDNALHLNLLLKITAGYYYKGQFEHAQSMAEKSVKLAKDINSPKALVKALSYRAMANALNVRHQAAYADLKTVRQLLTEYQEFSEQITVLNVLANAHFHLEDYKTAVALYNKILVLRQELSKEFGLDKTYYNLGKSYLKLAQFDDAYHAFWQSNNIAEERNAPIKIAYAKMGLGRVLYKQKKYSEAFIQLKTAKAFFHGQNLPKPYLTTLLHLAKVASAIANKIEAYQYLIEAEIVAQQVEMSFEQIDLYLLLSAMYQDQTNYKKALQAHQRYNELIQKFNHSHHIVPDQTDAFATHKQRMLSLNMAEENDLHRQFSQRYQQQKKFIFFLLIAVSILGIIIIYLLFKARVTRLNNQYYDIEKPKDYIATPSQTKKFYQQHYKMARKYNYPLAVGYFSIDNWQELEFQVSKKIIAEVAKTIATLVNEYRDEFDQVGLINQGEYLFLCPHQDLTYLQALFEELTEALKGQFFANLGEFSVKVSYDYQSPSFQDIDPYIFLSQLSESTRAEYSSYKS